MKDIHIGATNIGCFVKLQKEYTQSRDIS